MEERKAVYAGTFDPLTVGHLWMIEQGSKLFDKLIVAIGVNPEKKTTFSALERSAMIFMVTQDMPGVTAPTIFTNLYLIDYARQVGASHILRGIRNESDYTYERGMRNVNGDLAPEITTVFLAPPREMAEISSGFVKGLVGPEGWEDIVKKYVPPIVLEKLKEAHNAKS